MINLTVGNPSLARIKTMKAPRDWANISVGMLSANDRTNLIALSKTAFTEEVVEDTIAVSVNF